MDGWHAFVNECNIGVGPRATSRSYELSGLCVCCSPLTTCLDVGVLLLQMVTIIIGLEFTSKFSVLCHRILVRLSLVMIADLSSCGHSFAPLASFSILA